jgi:hypothetical protein
MSSDALVGLPVEVTGMTMESGITHTWAPDHVQVRNGMLCCLKCIAAVVVENGSGSQEARFLRALLL